MKITLCDICGREDESYAKELEIHLFKNNTEDSKKLILLIMSSSKNKRCDADICNICSTQLKDNLSHTIETIQNAFKVMRKEKKENNLIGV